MQNQSTALKAASWASRLMVCGIFVAAGLDKVKHREGTRRYMLSKGMPMVPALLSGAIAVELGLAPALVLGFQPRVTAPLLAAFLVPTSLIFHDFWKLEGHDRKAQSINFLKNIAIVGGLATIALRDYELSLVERAHRNQTDGVRRPDYLDQLQQEAV